MEEYTCFRMREVRNTRYEIQKISRIAEKKMVTGHRVK
jgi:hypothetical protein